jgi:heme-degrading monooxygenase HmoA
MAVMLIGPVEGLDADTYDKVNQEMGLSDSNLPDGLISHTAAEDDGKMMIVDVWESMDKFNSFMENQLMPAMQKVGVEVPESPQPPEEIEVHNRFSA